MRTRLDVTVEVTSFRHGRILAGPMVRRWPRLNVHGPLCGGLAPWAAAARRPEERRDVKSLYGSAVMGDAMSCTGASGVWPLIRVDRQHQSQFDVKTWPVSSG